MNTAFRSLIFEKDRSVMRAYVLVLLINLVAVNALYELGWINITIAPLFLPALIIGGFVFGVGMVLAGGCTSGTWYRTGKGMLGSFVALLGYGIGATAITVGALGPILEVLRRPTVDIYGEAATLANVITPDFWGMRWIVIAALVVAGGAWLIRSPRQRFVIGWGWRRTGLVVGILAVVAWVLSGLTYRDYGLSFTQPTVSLVQFLLYGDASAVNWSTFLVLGVPVGAFVAAKLAGEFALRVPEPGRLAQQFGGGIVMGLGAGLAGGCNIGHGITGVSALALSSLVATIFTILGVWTMTGLIYRRAARRSKQGSAGASAGVVSG